MIKLLLQIPILAIGLLVFNVFLILNPQIFDRNSLPLFSDNIPMPTEMYYTGSDLAILGGIVLLFLQILKNQLLIKPTWIERILAILTFAVLVVEFIFWKNAANPGILVWIGLALFNIGLVFVCQPKEHSGYQMGGIHQG